MSLKSGVKPTKTLAMLHTEIQAYFAQSSDTTPDLIEINTDLISEGYLDSLSLARFIMFIEEILGNEIGFEDFDIAHISSVSAIYDHFVL